jgi:hypothetical protein
MATGTARWRLNSLIYKNVAGIIMEIANRPEASVAIRE